MACNYHRIGTQPAEWGEAEEKFFFEVVELWELQRAIDVRIKVLLDQKVEENDVEEDLFLFAETPEKLIELKRETDAKVEELQQRWQSKKVYSFSGMLGID